MAYKLGENCQVGDLIKYKGRWWKIQMKLDGFYSVKSMRDIISIEFGEMVDGWQKGKY